VRALAQFVNTTRLLLEVALLEEPDDAWTMVASSGGRAAGPGAEVRWRGRRAAAPGPVAAALQRPG
jgi:hypothetical protein